jgi:GH15 family glucan-1,4-alpha-glucosidase
VYDVEQKRFSWLHEPSWTAAMRYEDESLICLTELKNAELALTVRFRDGVHMQENIFIRSIDIVNDSDRERTIKIFFEQDLHLYGDDQQNTALFAPEMGNPHKQGAIVHYRKRRYFLINGYTETQGVEDFSVGKVHYKNLEGTWKDAEDGVLAGNPIDQGSVDSVIGFTHHLGAHMSSKQYYWICAGRNHHEIENLNNTVLKNTPEHLLDTTQQYWSNWTNQRKFGKIDMSEKIVKLLKQSLLIIRTQIDRGGAIIAANDSDIMEFNKDTYTYMWARDGALVAHALDSAGYIEVTRRFFQFCSKIVTSGGFMLHKYNPDGSVGSSWHPWYRDGKPLLPIQEDETALVLYALDYHYEQFHDMEFIRPMYHSFIKPAANFLYEFVNQATSLPKASYDLWEEHLGVNPWTTAATIAGLRAAHKLALIMGHPESAERYDKRADEMRKALKEYLWSEKDGRFYKKIKVDERGNVIERDNTVDASTMGVSLFGVLPADDDMVVRNNKIVRERLWVPTSVGGLARYDGDKYQQTKGNEHVPGNPWIITTLWYAMWVIDRAHTAEEMNEAVDLINWVANKALPTGMLPEQIDFQTAEHLSVSPLTWSHATFVEAILKYRHRLKEFGVHT